MQRSTVLAVAAAVLVGAGVLAGVGASPAGTAAADPPDEARLTVTGVAVSPATPVVEEPVTMAVTLRNSAGSPSPAAVDWVAIRNGSTTVANATDPGTLSAGETLTVPLTAAFDAAGAKDLTVVAVATDDEGNRTRVRRPLSLVVEDARPQLAVDLVPAATGERTPVSVTVANPTNGEVRDLAVTVAGDGLDPIVERRTVPDLAAGESATVNLSVRPTVAGDRPLRVSLSYTTGAGVRAGAARNRTLSVAPADRDLGVRVEAVRQDQEQDPIGGIQGVLGGGQTTEDDDGEGRPTTVEVTVTNFGNAPARGVVVTPTAGDRTLPRQAVPGPIPPGGSASVTVDLSTVSRSGAVEFAVDYRMAGEAGAATASYDYRPAVGSVTVTGVSMAYEDGELQVEGNAGNVGGAPVEGVVVSVGDATGVEPAYPGRDYFVGTVDGSEFAPFELVADVDAENVTAIPIEVAYTVDGVRRTERVRVPYDDSLTPPDRRGGGGLFGLDPTLLLGIGLGVALVLVALGGWLGVRRFGGAGGERTRQRAPGEGGDD